MTVYKIRINKNSLVTPEILILFFKEMTKMKKYHMNYFFHKEVGKKLKNEHWQGYVETNLDLTSRQILYQKKKQNIKDIKNAHSITISDGVADEHRYKCYCTKDIDRENISEANIETNLTAYQIHELINSWDNTYKPLADKHLEKKTETNSKKLMNFLKENEFQFLPAKDNMSYEWHNDLLNMIMKYYHINCIFFDNYIIKKAMCLALATYDSEYIQYVIQDKWQDFVKEQKSI